MERNSDQRDNSDSAKTKESCMEAWVGYRREHYATRPKPPSFFHSSVAIAPCTIVLRFTDSTPGIGQYKLCLKKIIFLAGYANPLAFKVFKLRNYREIYEGKLSLLPTLASAQLQMPRVVSQRTKKRLMIHVCVWSFRNR